ncbi:MAG: hypothetical protein AAGA56_31725 [Myxococcota bacterium]
MTTRAFAFLLFFAPLLAACAADEEGRERFSLADAGLGEPRRDDDSPSCDYAFFNSCGTATEMTRVSGDLGRDRRSVSGNRSEFVRLWVGEDDEQQKRLGVRARLVTAPGVEFDLIVHEGGAENPSCEVAQTTVLDTDFEYFRQWEDNPVWGDGRWLVFEIVYAGGEACGADPQWVLTVEGNAN